MAHLAVTTALRERLVDISNPTTMSQTRVNLVAAKRELAERQDEANLCMVELKHAQEIMAAGGTGPKVLAVRDTGRVIRPKRQEPREGSMACCVEDARSSRSRSLPRAVCGLCCGVHFASLSPCTACCRLLLYSSLVRVSTKRRAL